MKKNIVINLPCNVGDLILIKVGNHFVKGTVSSIEICRSGIKLYAIDEKGDSWDFWDKQEGKLFITPLNVGDLVKIKRAVSMGYPSGAICKIINVDYKLENYIGMIAYEVVSLNYPIPCSFWYVDEDLERGSMKWIPDDK